MTDEALPAEGAEPTEAEHEQIAHVMPIPILLAVFAALIVGTIATVAAAYVDLGELNLLIALGIATAKASLVAVYFMHLRYDNPFHALIFCIALAFLALFLMLTLLDTSQYRPEIQNWG